MKYNFDTIETTDKTNSIKWNMYNGEDHLGMNTASMDFHPAECITNALQSVVNRNMYDYHYKPADFEKTICDWWQRKYSWNIQEEWIQVTPGMWTAMNLCMLAFTSRGDRVIMQSPYFHPIQTILDTRGITAVYNPMIYKDGSYEFDLDDFEKKVRENKPKVYVMVNPHNPTGRCFRKEELLRIVDICDRYGVIIVSDEVHHNFTYDGHQHIPVGSLSKKAQNLTVCLNAASKAYNVMDLTFAYAVIANPELKRRFMKEADSFCYTFATNPFSVAALMAAYSKEATEWEQQLNSYLYGNMNYIMNFVEKNIPRVKAIRPEASFMIWMDFRDLGMDSEELKDFFLTKVNVSFSWGENFGPLGEGFERVNFATPRVYVEEFCRRLQSAIESLK